MDIRKISVGLDYKSSMHYIVGQKVLGESHEIHLIRNEDGFVKVYIINEKQEVLLWKSFSPTTPMSIEYNVSF